MGDDSEPSLTEAAVRRLSKSQSYDRGESYYEQGAVLDVVRRGETLRADVEGSQYDPYTVAIEFDDAGIADTDCSCPYDHGGICKHRVAVLLTYVRNPGEVTHRPPISDLVERADQDTLRNILVDLVERRPGLAEWVETRLEAADAEEQVEKDERSSVEVNVESIRSQVKYILPSGGHGRGGGPRDVHAAFDEAVEELDELLEQAWAALEADDGETALEVLEAITEELVGGDWIHMMPPDATGMFEFFDDLNEAFTEAVLTAELSRAERETWARRLSEWGEELARYMGQSPFRAASTAAADGWESESLQRALRGELDVGEFGNDDSARSTADVLTARLNVLERQDRIEEYLNLAAAAGEHKAYATMLGKQGRVEEAVTWSSEWISTPAEFLSVAKTLREHDYPNAALEVAAQGLTVEGLQKEALAEWVRDRASSMGNSELAMNAAITAFKAEPSLSAYQAVEELADEDWETIRTDLLDYVREDTPRGRKASQHVEVFLYEEQYDDAIAVAESVDRSGVVEPVVDAVLEDRPHWAVRVCKEQAEPIIEEGQYDRYSQAVRWLEKAGRAAQAADELDTWRADIEDILDRHNRKRKLVPMLEDLLDEFPQ